MKLFVYGTLKSGQENHHYCADAISKEPAIIQGRLFDYGEYPALVLGGGVVYGELLTFADDSVLPVLDELEEVEYGVYERSMQPVHVGTQIVEAWVYHQSEVTEADYLP
ncbi:MAG: gamma-glutamylcyclotransferase family protein, partial [Corynebacterium sp.]|nr:gamma-glutamylcyclotransferase family protein [Corynebacterium sp.]